MKKIILLLVPCLISLAGCAKNNAPSFERYSHLVSFQEFKSGIEERKFDSYLSFASSTKGTAYFGAERVFSSSLGDVSISNEQGKDEKEITFAFDSENNRSSINEKGESSFIVTGAEVDEQRVSKTTVSTQYQYNDKLASFILLDMKEKTYKKYDNKNVTDSILNTINEDYMICQGLIKQYSSYDDEFKSRFAFYIDGGLFTMTYVYSVTKDSVSGDISELFAKTKTTYDYLFQFGVEDGKYQFRSKCITTTEDVYLMNYFNHIKDEVATNTLTNTCSLEIGPSTSTIKEVDISSFSSLDKDPEGGLLL